MAKRWTTKSLYPTVAVTMHPTNGSCHAKLIDRTAETQRTDQYDRRWPDGPLDSERVRQGATYLYGKPASAN